MKTKKTYHHGNLREVLLNAALEILDSSGVEAVSIRAIARMANVSHAAPANHFADRRALLTAISVLIFKQLATTIDTALASGPAARKKRIKVFADSLLEFGLNYPHRYKLMWRRDLLDDDDLELQQTMDGIYAALLAELSSNSFPSNYSSDTFAIALWSLVHGYVSMRLDGNFEARQDEISGQPRHHAMLDLFLQVVDC